MRFSTIELLHDINVQGRLFSKNNYIILNGNVFPFFFLQFLKIILSKQYAIKEWISLDCEQVKNAVSGSFCNNLHYYKENQTVFENYQSFGFVVEIKEKNELSAIKKIIDDPLNKDNYYIFFTYKIYESSIKLYSYYSVDDIIHDDNKIVYINFLKKQSSEEYFNSIYFFFQYFYKKIEKLAYLEFLFTIFQYIVNIKKNNIGEFIDHYINNSIHLLPNDSIFDLATCFFQKKSTLFFEKWKNMKYKYAIEFWYYFWQDQLWYAQLALFNKKNIEGAIFYKKVNRWFLKTGINYYNVDELLQASIRLYNFDYLYKNLQSNAELDLESFFYMWFDKK